nr:unnamed protein product [Spirometra erinaceieuropaei]
MAAKDDDNTRTSPFELPSDPGASEPPVITSYVSSKADTEADFARPPLRPPNPFHPGDDFSLWAFRAQNFLRAVPFKHAGSYLVSLLDDSAARQVMATGVSLDVPVSEILKTLSDLFDHGPAPSLALEALWSRRQLTTESVDTAFPNESPGRREMEVLKRFTLGVRNTELYSKFVRKQYTSLQKALEVARGYEAAEVAQRMLASTHLFAVAEHCPSSRRTQRHSVGERQNPQANCPYCRRFGRWAQRCGHNPPIRPQFTSGRSAFSAVSLPSLAVLSRGARTPFTVPGTLNGRMVSFLLDTGASCSVICSNIRWVNYEPSPRLAQLSAANGSVLCPDGQACCSVTIGDFMTEHTFVCARIQWDVILGMDFLDRHHASFALPPLRICLDGTEVFLADTLAVINDGPWWIPLLSGSVIDESSHQTVVRLLDEFAVQFDVNNRSLGHTKVLQHCIDTADARPIRQAPRRIPIYYQRDLEKMIQDMLNRSIVRPSSSPWASPIVLVKKKDGTLRLCVDYRRLNSVTKRDSFPLPRIDNTIDALSGAAWFSTLDLASGYWQVEVHPADRAKTAFMVPSGLYEFNMMPFGLANAPATFQRLMTTVLRDITPTACLIYLDDIIVHGKTVEEHNAHLREVLLRLRCGSGATDR